MAKRPSKSKPAPKPAVKIPGAGKGGKTPPPQHRFKKGPDPKRCAGGPTAGAILKNCINGFYRRNVRSKTLRRIIADESQADHKRQAAEFILHSRRATTLADFDQWIDGTKTLRQLAKEGVDISVVKRVREGKCRQYVDDDGNDVFERGERSIELYEDAGHNLDRIIEHTDLTPGEAERYKRIDAGKATEGVAIMPAIFERPVGPPPEPAKDGD